MGCGIVLVPWPNRIAGGGGPTRREAAAGHHRCRPRHAIHGLLRNTAYTVDRARDDAVTLAATVYPQHGYPFILDTEVDYASATTG